MATSALSSKPPKVKKVGTKVYFEIVLRGELDTIEDHWEEKDEYPEFKDEWNGKAWTEDRVLQLVQETAPPWGGIYDMLFEWELLDTDEGNFTVSLTPFDQQNSI